MPSRGECRRFVGECFCAEGALGSEGEEQRSCSQAGDSASPALLDHVFMPFGRAWSRVWALHCVPEASGLHLPVVLTQWVISSFTL